MRTHRFGQRHPLQVATLESNGLQTVSIGQGVCSLGNDGPVIEDSGDVVRGRPNHLDTTFHGLSVWVGPREGGEKGVMHIDDLFCSSCSEPARGILLLIRETVRASSENEPLRCWLQPQRGEMEFLPQNTRWPIGVGGHPDNLKIQVDRAMRL